MKMSRRIFAMGRRELAVWGAGAATALALGGVIWCVMHYSTPEGMFDYPEFGAVGYSYLKVQQGQVQVIFEDGTYDYGTYRRVKDKWLWISRNGEHHYLVGTWRELRVFGVDGREEVSISRMPRLFLPPEAVRRLKALFKREATA